MYFYFSKNQQKFAFTFHLIYGVFLIMTKIKIFTFLMSQWYWVSSLDNDWKKKLRMQIFIWLCLIILITSAVLILNLFFRRIYIVVFLYIWIQPFYNIWYNSKDNCYYFRMYNVLFGTQLLLPLLMNFQGITTLGI